jgi:hypothetical protein
MIDERVFPSVFNHPSRHGGTPRQALELCGIDDENRRFTLVGDELRRLVRGGNDLAEAILCVFDRPFRHGGIITEAPLHTALSGPTRTTILPILSPLKSPMNAFGAFSTPSTTVSRQRILPSFAHAAMSRWKSASMS